MTKYISDPDACLRTAEEFLQEFKDYVYPAYASFNIDFQSALIIWKLNVISNQLSDSTSEDDWEKSPEG